MWHIKQTQSVVPPMKPRYTLVATGLLRKGIRIGEENDHGLTKKKNTVQILYRCSIVSIHLNWDIPRERMTQTVVKG